MSEALESALKAVARLHGDGEPDAVLWAEFLETVRRLTAKDADPRQGRTPAGRAPLWREEEGSVRENEAYWQSFCPPGWVANAQENWHKLDFSLRYGRRGLERRTIAVGRGRERPLSILQLRYAYGLQVQLTHEQIRVWMLNFWKKEGRWPSEESKDVWETDSTGSWHRLVHRGGNGDSWDSVGGVLVV